MRPLHSQVGHAQLPQHSVDLGRVGREAGGKAGRLTFCATLSASLRCRRCGTNPRSCRARRQAPVGTVARSRPITLARALAHARRPVSKASRVDLPLPEAPVISRMPAAGRSRSA